MSDSYIREQLKNRGKTSVVVMLGADKAHARRADRLRNCFQRSDHHTLQSTARSYRFFEGGTGLYLENLGVVYGEVNEAGYKKLRQELGATDEIAPSMPLRPVRGLGPRVSTPSTSKSWGLERIGAPALWQRGFTGKDLLVAHLDTGIDGDHPSFKDAIHAFAEFNAVGQQIPGAAPTDSALHGTHTAGTIAGRPLSGWDIGVAPGCKLVSAAVIEDGDKVARILAGVDWAMGFPIRVINLSVGFPGYFAEYVPIVKRIRDRGIFPVFAAGNEGPGISCSPANYPQAIAVGAMDEQGAVDASSCSERLTRRRDPIVPDLVMPGIDIISANAGGGNLRPDSGTSMAAPHLAGLAALLWQAVPDATVAEMEAAIFASCTRDPSMEKDRANRGLPNAEAALADLEKRAARRKVRANEPFAARTAH